MQTYETVGEYLKQVPRDAQGEAKRLWLLLRELVPEGEEAIRYGMPTIRFNGKNLVHFAVQKNHYGFYPAPSGVKQFEAEIAKRYQYSKGAIQFPIGKPLPLALITKIVRFRVKETKLTVAQNKKKKSR